MRRNSPGDAEAESGCHWPPPGLAYPEMPHVGTCGPVTSKQQGQKGATEEVGAQNVAGPVGAEVYPGDANSQDQEDQERLDGSTKPRPADKSGGQIDKEAEEDQRLVSMPAGKAKTAKRVGDADQVGGWPGTVNEQLQEGTKGQNGQSAHGGKALSSPMYYEQTWHRNSCQPDQEP